MRMMLSVQRQVHDAIADAVRRHYGLADVPAFAVEVPPNRALGDLAVTVAFQLARTLRKAPRAIAQELAGALGQIPGVVRSVAAPNGYLNLYLDRPAFLLARGQYDAPRDKPVGRLTPGVLPPFPDDLLLPRDYDRPHPALRAEGDAPAVLHAVARTCAERGLTPLLDVVPDRIAAAWDAALTADRPCVVSFRTDPEVPPLPPHITFEQAKKFMTSLLHDPSRSAMIRDAMKQMLAAVKK